MCNGGVILDPARVNVTAVRKVLCSNFTLIGVQLENEFDVAGIMLKVRGLNERS